MASAFGHALVAITAGKTYSKKFTSLKFFILGCVCATFPDLDVIMFQFVSYNHFLGHRGFFHSLVFCFLFALLITFLFFRTEKAGSKPWFIYVFYFFLCGASHAIFDMLTTGGLGIAIFAPFDNTRYFFPWRPIKVSPIGIGNFFSDRGWHVIKSELVWIGIPCFVYMLVLKFIRKN